MNQLSFLRTCVTAFTALLLAGPVLATTPASKRPLAHRTRPVQAITKAPAAGRTPAIKGNSKSNGPTTMLVAALAPTVAAPAEAPASTQVVKLKGIVLNPDGSPCPGASVYPAGAPRQLVVTDAKGAFTLPVPVGSAVSVRVDYFGVGSSRVEVAAPSAEVLHITLGQ